TIWDPLLFSSTSRFIEMTSLSEKRKEECWLSQHSLRLPVAQKPETSVSGSLRVSLRSTLGGRFHREGVFAFYGFVL
ncbi:hypothetical protein, partial [Jeotgalibacillus proteolyticus]|uniref:hypothetical protein n=1 Tax=Jeotgalibacillus proteolyticus TaxID=2082395 RepID=UPI003CF56D9D